MLWRVRFPKPPHAAAWWGCCGLRMTRPARLSSPRP
jgi:hypothetical protein